MTFDVSAPQPEIQVFAEVTDGRRLRAPAKRTGREFTIDLAGLEGLGEARFIVEVTADFRTARASTGPVELPPASVHGWIIEPSPSSAWPFWWRGSLIGNLFDANGRRIKWALQPVGWAIDGKRLNDNRQVAGWSAESAGAHRIELVRDSGNGHFDVLDQTTTTVLPPTPEQREYGARIGIPIDEESKESPAMGSMIPGSVASASVDIHDISISPVPPAQLEPGSQVDVQFRYRSTAIDGIRIFVRPMTGGSPSGGYAASGSPLYPAGSGDGNASFTLNQAPATADRIRFQVVSADQATLLEEFFVVVGYSFVE